MFSLNWRFAAARIEENPHRPRLTAPSARGVQQGPRLLTASGVFDDDFIDPMST
jgi:hypothetical protein